MKLTIDVPLTISMTTTGKSLDDMRQAYGLDADTTETEVHETVKRVTTEGLIDEVGEMLWEFGFDPKITPGEVVLHVRADETDEERTVINYLNAVSERAA